MVGLFRAVRGISTFFFRFLFKVLMLVIAGVLVTQKLMDTDTVTTPPRSPADYDSIHENSPIKPIEFRPADLTPSSDLFDAHTQKLKQDLLSRLRQLRNRFMEQAQESVRFHGDQYLKRFLPAPKSPQAEKTSASEEIIEEYAAEKGNDRLLQVGKASFYGKRWNGRKTANGEIYNDEKLTAAHKNLPFNTYVRVVRRDNGRSVVVRINDRGPFVKGRVIDLSTAGARRLGMIEEGVTEVMLFKATLADYLKQFKRRY